MSYISRAKHIFQAVSSQGDGSGVTDMGVDGKTITAGTTASPVVCTSTAHGYVTDDWVFIDGATGTTEINGLRQVVKINNDTFSLLDEAGDAVDSAGTFGGTVDSNIALVSKPTSLERIDIQRLRGSMADATVAVDGFGGIARLTNGVVLAFYDGSTLSTIATIRGWNDFSLYGKATNVLNDIANAKMEWAMDWDFTENVSGLDITDLRIYGADGQFLAIYTVEDLAALISLRFTVIGNL